MSVAGASPELGTSQLYRERGKGKRSWSCWSSSPHNIQSYKIGFSSRGGGRGTLSLSLSIPRVAGDFSTITLRCKDLRVLHLDIEGVEATLDISHSIEVRQGCT